MSWTLAINEPKIGFIGIGTLGKGLALALGQLGYPVVGAYSRTPASAQWLAERMEGCRAFGSAQELAETTDVVFVTTPDEAISTVIQEVEWRSGQGVVHCSGVSGTALIQRATSLEVCAGAFHPYQTFAGIEDPSEAVNRLAGITFAVSATGWLREFLDQVARGLGSRTIQLGEEQRQLYHTSAILSCGYLATLIQTSIELWRSLGFSAEEAIGAVFPLARTTLENIERRGVLPSVTGPLVRGDVTTVGTHLTALAAEQPHLIPLYCELTRLSLPLARGRGIAQEQLTELVQLIEDYSESYSRRSQTCPE